MTGRNTDYYDAAFAPLRQGDLDIGAPAAPERSEDLDPQSSLLNPELFTYSEAHRHACEVRYALRLSLTARDNFLKHVAEKRGEKAAERLREDVEK